MTRKLFWENSYLTQCEANIVDIKENKVIVDQTIAFAFSGGQKSDKGTINGYDILLAEKIGSDIVYTLPENHDLKVGDEVNIEIDWAHRYKIMKLHFLAELVLEIVYQTYNFPEKIGANITEEKARVDFVWDGNISSIFPEIEPMINDLISKDMPIKTGYIDIENERRYWEIEGFAKISCGGTHVKSTGEIGSFRLKRRNNSRGKERIEIYLSE
ncbi:alanyl-tRNA editing protein [Cetobacterium somerae]|uniref:alanyl-tRNA editing protein n=1 Tax=Cetobacterium somerae TaxID=188913 RepID=UPI00211EA35F|nr:alanyl-tRNA editing protein [Cetobacterium somerae]MCQ9627179.1 alanyl-tRNA editing protein [Cetobacterium somerae]